MKINLSNKQYKSLMKIVFLGNYMVNGPRLHDEAIEEFEDIKQYIFSFYKDFQLENWIEKSDKHNELFATSELEDEVMAFINDYDDECFWDELINRLGRKDFINHYGENNILKMSIEERIEKEECRGRAARLPGDALLGPGRGRPPLHRPERAGGRRALAPGRRAPAGPRPGRPAGDRDGLVPGAGRPGRGRRRRPAPDGGGPRRAAGRRAHPLAAPGRPRPRAAHRRDLPPPGRLLPDGPRRRPRRRGRRARGPARGGGGLGDGRLGDGARALGQHPPGGDRPDRAPLRRPSPGPEGPTRHNRGSRASDARAAARCQNPRDTDLERTHARPAPARRSERDLHRGDRDLRRRHPAGALAGQGAPDGRKLRRARAPGLLRRHHLPPGDRATS